MEEEEEVRAARQDVCEVLGEAARRRVEVEPEDDQDNFNRETRNE